MFKMKDKGRKDSCIYCRSSECDMLLPPGAYKGVCCEWNGKKS